MLILSILTIYSAVNAIKKAALLLASNIERMDTCSTVQHRMTGSPSKTPINCFFVVKMYNKGIRDVDLIDQKTAAYRLDRRSKCRFYLGFVLYLINVALVNSHIVYQDLNGNLNLLDLKINSDYKLFDVKTK